MLFASPEIYPLAKTGGLADVSAALPKSSGAGERLCAELSARGYRVLKTPLTAFLRSGGSAFCLTLRLDRRSVPVAADGYRVAVA